MGVFNAFAQASGTKELTLEELDAKTRGDRQLLCIMGPIQADSNVIQLTIHSQSVLCVTLLRATSLLWLRTRSIGRRDWHYY